MVTTLEPRVREHLLADYEVVSELELCLERDGQTDLALELRGEVNRIEALLELPPPKRTR